MDLDSARRSVESQQEIMDHFTEKYGADYAAKVVAVPGYSEHHTGLALDLYLIVDGKDIVYNEDDEKQQNRPGRFIKPEKKKEEVVEEVIKVITLPDTITIKDLADKMKQRPADIIKKLFLAGQIVTLNQEISYEDAENIAMEYEILYAISPDRLWMEKDGTGYLADLTGRVIAQFDLG